MAKETGLRKRSQIKKANRTMFIWVASMSAIAMVCLVVSYHLVLSTFFKGRVIAAQMQTIGNLDTSIKNTDSNNEESLGAQILALDTNENLAMVKANPEDQAIQVILDALPSTNNALSFGASLQKVLLVGPQGVNIKNITIESVGNEVIEEGVVQRTDTAADADSASTSEDAVNKEEAISDSLSSMSFNFVVEGPETSLQEILQRLEKSIRTIYVKSISIQRQGNANEMSVSGNVFYQLEKTADLQEKVVK